MSAGASAATKKRSCAIDRLISALHETSAFSLGVINNLLKQDDGLLEQIDENGKTPLHHIVELPHRFDLIKSFTSKCPKASMIVDKNGQTAGHIIVKDCLDCFDRAFDGGVFSSSRRDKEGFTLMHYACLNIYADPSNPSTVLYTKPLARDMFVKLLDYNILLCLIKSKDGQLPFELLNPTSGHYQVCAFYAALGAHFVKRLADYEIFPSSINQHMSKICFVMPTWNQLGGTLTQVKKILVHNELQVLLEHDETYINLISLLLEKGKRVEFSHGNGGMYNRSSILNFTPEQRRSVTAVYVVKGINVLESAEEDIPFWSSLVKLGRKSANDNWNPSHKDSAKTIFASRASDEIQKTAQPPKEEENQPEEKECMSSSSSSSSSSMMLLLLGIENNTKLETHWSEKDIYLSEAENRYKNAETVKAACRGEINDPVHELLGRAFVATRKAADSCDQMIELLEEVLQVVVDEELDHKNGKTDPSSSKSSPSKSKTLDADAADTMNPQQKELEILRFQKDILNEMAGFLFGDARTVKTICGDRNDAVDEMLKRAYAASVKAATIAARMFDLMLV